MENRTYDVGIPDGYEVESAVLHPPNFGGSTAGTMHGVGTKSKLQQMRERGLEQWEHLQHSMTEQSERGLEKIDGVRRLMAERAGVMRSSGIERWHGVQRTMADRSVAMKSSLIDKVEALKPVVREKTMMLKSDMQANTPKWAGIAAGAGFLLGIGGRVMRHRMRHHHHRHDMYSGLVIIEGAC